MSSIQSVCFTGHRPEKLLIPYDEEAPLFRQFRAVLKKQILEAIDRGATDFYNGMAKGTDLLAGELVLELSELFPQLRQHAVCPYAGQPNSYPVDWLRRFTRVLNRAASLTVLHETYTRGCFHERNCYLVDHADLVIAAFDGNYKTGTGQTLLYAQKKRKEIRIIRLDREDLPVDVLIP